jgi:hypothetical protein
MQGYKLNKFLLIESNNLLDLLLHKKHSFLLCPIFIFYILIFQVCDQLTTGNISSKFWVKLAV